MLFSTILGFVVQAFLMSQEKLNSLLACVSASADQRLRELGLQLHLGNVAMQIEVNTYSILLNAKKQLLTLPSARSLYVKAKHLLRDHTTSQCKHHLQTLSVQSKFEGSAELEDSCKTWNRLAVSTLANYPFYCVQHLILCPLLLIYSGGQFIVKLSALFVTQFVPQQLMF